MLILRRLWHDLFGHPTNQVVWGEQEAVCQCGTSWTLGDYY